MSVALLGSHFDIHGGGLDLKFPHHENEIAQSCAATGDRFAEIWMHNGFVNVDNEKMSKSLGNFFTVREVLPKAVRHPRGAALLLALEPLPRADQLFTGAARAGGRGARADHDAHCATCPSRRRRAVPRSEHTARFQEAMDDDFNTPEAIAVLQTMTREINSAKDAHDGARGRGSGG